MSSYSCPSCEATSINGMPCHETGCPDRRLDLFSRMYVHKCFECGYQVESENKYTYECCNEEDV